MSQPNRKRSDYMPDSSKKRSRKNKFDLGKLPSEVLKEILMKTDLTTLIKMRRSSKELDIISEDNRKIIHSASNSYLCLCIGIDEETHSLTFKVDYEPYEKSLYPLSKIITNPMKQLSTVNFTEVRINVQVHHCKHDRPCEEWQILDEFLYNSERLGIHCKTLKIEKEEWLRSQTVDVLSTISFQNLSFHGSCSFEEFEMWPIQHCEHVKIHSLTDVPNELSPLIRNFTTFEFSSNFDYVNNGLNNGTEHMIAHFFEEIKKDRAARGNLEQIKMRNVNCNLYKKDGINILFDGRGRTPQNSVVFFTVYKMLIDGGVAYIRYCMGNYEIYFEETECDDEIRRRFPLLT